MQYGASCCTSEMVSSKGLCYGGKTSDYLYVDDAERPAALQLFGEDPAYMAKAAAMCERVHPDWIDINMGCPVPKVAGNGAGSALMRDPARAEAVVKAVVGAVSIPVTVKFRKGWDDNSVNYLDFGRRMEQAGASAVTLHARTKTQMYGGRADWSAIKALKQTLHIPVIGNGDVTTAQECAAMYEETGCDLVMIGRGSYGNPWLFVQIQKYLTEGILLPEPTVEERMATMLTHIRLLVAYKGEGTGMREARRHAAFYLKGLPGAASMRNECASLTGITQLEALAERVIRAAEKEQDV